MYMNSSKKIIITKEVLLYKNVKWQAYSLMFK